MADFDFETLAAHREDLRKEAERQISQHMGAKVEASDVVQEALLRAYQGRAKFNGQTQYARRAWLRAILRNTLLEKLGKAANQKEDYRREQSIHGHEDDSAAGFDELLAASGLTPSGQVSLDEQRARLRSKLEELPKELWLAVALRYEQDLTLQEIAKELDCSESAAVGRIRRGIIALRKLLEQ